MNQFDVSFFKAYPFKIGQKIHIDGGRRAGDWEVTGITENTVRLRCPASGREFDWTRFCYLVEERKNVIWPQKDDL